MPERAEEIARDGLADFVMFQSVTVKYSDDDMRCDVLYNGRPTAIYALRADYDSPFRIYVAHRPDSPILTETKGWGVVGGISMLVDALLTQARP
jgi:hypothetical protein